jgi:hypothetical protein
MSLPSQSQGPQRTEQKILGKANVLHVPKELGTYKFFLPHLAQKKKKKEKKKKKKRTFIVSAIAK